MSLQGQLRCYLEQRFKFRLWIHTCASSDNRLHDSGRNADRQGIFLQREKAVECIDGDTIVLRLVLKMRSLI